MVAMEQNKANTYLVNTKYKEKNAISETSTIPPPKIAQRILHLHVIALFVSISYE